MLLPIVRRTSQSDNSYISYQLSKSKSGKEKEEGREKEGRWYQDRRSIEKEFERYQIFKERKIGELLNRGIDVPYLHENREVSYFSYIKGDNPPKVYDSYEDPTFYDQKIYPPDNLDMKEIFYPQIMDVIVNQDQEVEYDEIFDESAYVSKITDRIFIGSFSGAAENMKSGEKNIKVIRYHEPWMNINEYKDYEVSEKKIIGYSLAEKAFQGYDEKKFYDFKSILIEDEPYMAVNVGTLSINQMKKLIKGIYHAYQSYVCDDQTIIHINCAAGRSRSHLFLTMFLFLLYKRRPNDEAFGGMNIQKEDKNLDIFEKIENFVSDRRKLLSYSKKWIPFLSFLYHNETESEKMVKIKGKWYQNRDNVKNIYSLFSKFHEEKTRLLNEKGISYSVKKRGADGEYRFYDTITGKIYEDSKSNTYSTKLANRDQDMIKIISKEVVDVFFLDQQSLTSLSITEEGQSIYFEESEKLSRISNNVYIGGISGIKATARGIGDGEKIKTIVRMYGRDPVLDKNVYSYDLQNHPMTKDLSEKFHGFKSIQLNDSDPMEKENPITEKEFEKLIYGVYDAYDKYTRENAIIVINCSAGQSRSHLFLTMFLFLLFKRKPENSIIREIGLKSSDNNLTIFKEIETFLIKKREILLYSPRWITFLAFLYQNE